MWEWKSIEIFIKEMKKLNELRSMLIRHIQGRNKLISYLKRLVVEQNV